MTEAFETYRSSPPRPVTVPRLIGGMVIILACWTLVTVLVIFPVIFAVGGDLAAFTTSASGNLAMFATFAGIWLGVWLATRTVHREAFRNILGWSGRISWSDFAKGFMAIALTSILSEVLMYLIRPDFARSAIPVGEWLIFLLPVAVLCLVQTAGEELLFRGYLTRNLANRFRSPWVWALVPSLIFTCMHVSPSMGIADAATVVISIGSLTAVLVALVYVTGNLGAPFGVHMANNFLAFTVISHQSDFSKFSLFNGFAIDSGSVTTTESVLIIVNCLVCVGLSALLLLHPRSLLRVGSDACGRSTKRSPELTASL